MKTLRIVLVFIIMLLIVGVSTVASASSFPQRSGEMAASTALDVRIDNTKFLDPLGLPDLLADNLNGTVDVQIFDGNYLHQIDHLLYVLSNNEVVAGKRVNQPTRVVLSLSADVIYNSRIHTNDHRLYKIIGNHILPPESNSLSASIYSFDGDKFYRGSQINNESQRIFTRRGDKIFRGTSNDLADVVLSFQGDFEELQPFLVIIADLRP
ncbi:MAG: hypothetical protein EXR62_00145 [Chloroflexi bacterium]|nr:hypothetical protein [Chloroflexota bacterium]